MLLISWNRRTTKIYFTSWFISSFKEYTCQINYRSSNLEGFCKKAVLKTFKIITEKHLHWIFLFNNTAGLQLIKMRHWPRRFLVNFKKFLKTVSETKMGGRSNVCFLEFLTLNLPKRNQMFLENVIFLITVTSNLLFL